jgi:hypothetical protein
MNHNWTKVQARLGKGFMLCVQNGFHFTMMALLEVRRPISPARHWQSSGPKDKMALLGLEVCYPLPRGVMPAKLLRLQQVSNLL